MILRGEHIDIHLLPGGAVEVKARPGGTEEGYEAERRQCSARVTEHLLSGGAGLVVEDPQPVVPIGVSPTV